MTDYLTSPKSKVLDWLRTLRLPGQCCRYQFSATSDDTIFCTCFALFILDLVRQTGEFSPEQRQDWISYIQSFQNKEHGYFEPEVYYRKDKERGNYQLTCFCLSALRILGAEPKFPLKFIEQWKTPDDVKKYLYERGCHEGKPGSGNKAMFLAIFLTYEYERTKERHLLNKMNAWFEFHDEAQNTNGFWGRDKSSHFFHGLQNGFHQLLIYFYHHRTINKLNKIVDVVLMSQDRQGFFAPTPGGGACCDYDALHILVNAYKTLNYKRQKIAESLERAFCAILRNQNEDGGFCQSKQRPNSVIDLVKSIPFFLSGTAPYLWYTRSRKSIGVVIRKKATVTTGWTKKKRKWDESNLWDTWFRCLSLAEIANTIELKNNLGLDKTNFHKMIGLGHFSR